VEQALAYIRGHDDVWFTTGDEIFRWWESEFGRLVALSV
jgi:hypothetical protein